jgi:formate dehydrogenase iron-sulfur subunit
MSVGVSVGASFGLGMRAVDVFSDLHDRGRAPSTGWYESRIPIALPTATQQFRFAVELDACTGCKACVVACHSLNGLDAEEQWRWVGSIEGVSATGHSDQRTVTHACHHCAEPSCLQGCPANAYVKDDRTGAVVHLDDECIGCSYCTMTCPYEVPVFNERLGIVRKCDLCQGRLLAGEAPACVQGCPNGAIRIEIVDRNEPRLRVAAASSVRLVPDAPVSSTSSPSSVYRGETATLHQPAAAATPSPAHTPLAVMLTLTQLAAGFAIAALLDGDTARITSIGALGLSLLGAVASTLHLGRPALAWRAVLGFRHSWLSREAVAISAFVGSSVALVSAQRVFERGGDVPLRVITAGLGVAMVWTSVMVYAVTKRSWWSLRRTSIRFAAPALLVGLSAATVGDDQPVLWQVAAVIAFVTMLSVHAMTARFARLSTDAAIRRSQQMIDESSLLERHGINLCLLGATVAMLMRLMLTRETGSAVVLVATLVLVAMATLIDRRLFFTAVSPDRMPRS